MTVFTKILAGFMVSLLVIGGTAAMSVRISMDYEDTIREVEQIHIQGAVSLAKAMDALWRLRYGFPQFMVMDDQERRRIVAEEPKLYAEIEQNLKSYEATVHSQEAESLRQLWGSFERYVAARPKWFELYGAGKLKEAADWRARTTTPFGAETVAAFERQIDLQTTVAVQEVQDTLNRAQQSRALLYAMLAAMAITVVLVFLLAMRMLRPLKALHSAADRTVHDLFGETADTAGHDEIEALTVAFERMTQRFISHTEEMKLAGKALKESEEKHRTLFESSRDALMTIAPPSWRFSSGNRSAIGMFGVCDEAALTALGPWDISPELQPDGRPSSEKAAEIIETAMATGSQYFEWTHRRLGGASFPATVLLTRMEVGEQTILQATVRDITVRKALEEGLQKSYDDLKNLQTQLVQSGKLASIGELAAGVAHELNQPLMVIRGTAQLIERAARKGGLTPEALPTQLEPIDRNTKRMTRIINHLRNFSRQSEMEFTPVEINHVIEECFLLIGEQLKLRDIVVERDLAPDLPKIRGDANQLEQVIVNLLGNSRDAVTEAREKAAAEGREARPGRIVIITRLVKNTVEVLIRDTGGGIPADKISRIFDPFFTTKAAGRGTGLGLSISYGIIKDHEGEIEVAATGPEGTTMRLLLPAME
jgi:PAS domain S-box-containing protein